MVQTSLSIVVQDLFSLPYTDPTEDLEDISDDTTRFDIDGADSKACNKQS